MSLLSPLSREAQGRRANIKNMRHCRRVPQRTSQARRNRCNQPQHRFTLATKAAGGAPASGDKKGQLSLPFFARIDVWRRP
jgi:hypothetical protein